MYKRQEHISAYHLTYEKGTRIYEMLQSHRISEVDEESSLRFFSALMDTLGAAGYEHYEISNFCKPGMYSRHNTAYCKGIPYLGCGDVYKRQTGCLATSIGPSGDLDVPYATW